MEGQGVRAIPDPIAGLLDRARKGDTAAWNDIYALLYQDLRKVARAQLWHWANHALTPTSLLHDTWLRLFRKQDITAQNRRQLIALISRAMRMAILDDIRRGRASKRGGDIETVALDECAAPLSEIDMERLISLDSALNDLEHYNPRLARVVELRYFGGISESDIAALMGVHVRTVRRDWQAARLFLIKRLWRDIGPLSDDAD